MLLAVRHHSQLRKSKRSGSQPRKTALLLAASQKGSKLVSELGTGITTLSCIKLLAKAVIARLPGCQVKGVVVVKTIMGVVVVRDRQ